MQVFITGKAIRQSVVFKPYEMKLRRRFTHQIRWHHGKISQKIEQLGADSHSVCDSAGAITTDHINKSVRLLIKDCWPL